MFHSFLSKRKVADNIIKNNTLYNGKTKRRPLENVSSNQIKIEIPPKETDEYEEEGDLDDFNSDFTIPHDDVFKTLQTFNISDLKIGSPANPQDVIDYENILHKEMRKREISFPTRIVQQVLTNKQKAFALSYISRIHYKAQLSTNTLFTAFGIFNRIVRLTTVTEDESNTFGVAALIIASKMEDVKVLRTDIAVACTHFKIEKEDLLKKEIQISGILNFDFTFPTPLFFLNYYLRLSSLTQEKLLYARYVCEMCLTSECFDEIKSSAIAATAVLFTRLVYNSDEDPWPPILKNYTEYSLLDLKQHILDAYTILSNEVEENDFIRIKYEQSIYMKVALNEVPDPSNLF